MNKFPISKKIILVILCWIFPPLAFLYINRNAWAFIYFFVFIIIGAANLLILSADMGYITLGIFVIFSIIHALFITAKTPASQLKPKRLLLKMLQASMVLGLLFFCKFFVIDIYHVPSASMTPTIMPGNKVVVLVWGYKDIKIFNLTLYQWKNKHHLSRGDIVLLYQPDRPGDIIVKRIVAMPGDTVNINEKTLSINTPNIVRQHKISEQNTIESIGKMQYNIQFLSPKHRDNSLDSRYWGPVSQQAIIGKVIYIASQNN